MSRRLEVKEKLSWRLEVVLACFLVVPTVFAPISWSSSVLLWAGALIVFFLLLAVFSRGFVIEAFLACFFPLVAIVSALVVLL